MSRTPLSLLIALSSCVFWADAVDAEEPVVTEVQFQLHERKLWNIIYGAKLDATRWKPGPGEAPVSAAQAYRTAHGILSKTVGDTSSWECHHIRLVSYGEDRWLWEVMFSDEDPQGNGDYLIPSVYLDGSPVTLSLKRYKEIRNEETAGTRPK